MFVTLEDFFNNYRIKNRQQPNETVLNKGIMRLKRETRELKSIIDILTGVTLPPWTTAKIYERDEYVSYQDLIYKSRITQNFGNTPFSTDTVNWELITLDSVALSKGSIIKNQSYVATAGQTIFSTSFNIDSRPMVFIDGVLLDDARYTFSSSGIVLVNATVENENVSIFAGITYDSSLTLSKETFIAGALQFQFTTGFVLKSPSVFVDGSLQAETLYTYANSTVDFVTPLTGGEVVVIGNGSVLGSEIYSTTEIDTFLTAKRDVSDSYSAVEVDTMVAGFATSTDLSNQYTTLDTAKANASTTLTGYGILDAYTQTEINTALALKLDSTTYTASDVLSKLISVDGIGSNLDADLLGGIEHWKYTRIDKASTQVTDFSIASVSNKAAHLANEAVTPLSINEIFFDTDEVAGYAGEPNILMRRYDNTNALVSEGTVYHSANTQDMMIVREGYFNGTWEPTLDIDFSIANYTDYTWTVIVTPTVTGTEHDFNTEAGHTPYAGFDNNLTWDLNQSEYHYGYVSGNIVKMKAIHRDSATVIDLPARYHLVGIKNTFVTHAWVDQP